MCQKWHVPVLTLSMARSIWHAIWIWHVPMPYPKSGMPTTLLATETDLPLTLTVFRHQAANWESPRPLSCPAPSCTPRPLRSR